MMIDVDTDLELDVVALSPPPSSTASSVSGGDIQMLYETVNNDNNEKKYYCQRCLNHNLEFPRKGHKPHCQYANCNCNNCVMVETRRQLNNKLSKRKQPLGQKLEPIKGKKIRDPHCARCTAHGVVTPLRGHKRNTCKFANCTCESCNLVCSRRDVMAKQIKLRRDQQRARQSIEGRRSIDSDGNTSDTSKDTTPSPPPTIVHPQPMRPPYSFLPTTPLLPSVDPVLLQLTLLQMSFMNPINSTFPWPSN